MQNCLQVLVNKRTYDIVKPMAADPLAAMGFSVGLPVAQGYKLNSEDCVTFAIRVAKQLESRIGGFKGTHA